MEKVTVVGAGFMGTGIAQVCAQAGYDAVLIGGPRAKARLAFGHPPIGRLSSFALTHLLDEAATRQKKN